MEEHNQITDKLTTAWPQLGPTEELHRLNNSWGPFLRAINRPEIIGEYQDIKESIAEGLTLQRGIEELTQQLEVEEQRLTIAKRLREEATDWRKWFGLNVHGRSKWKSVGHQPQEGPRLTDALRSKSHMKQWLHSQKEAMFFGGKHVKDLEDLEQRFEGVKAELFVAHQAFADWKKSFFLLIHTKYAHHHYLLSLFEIYGPQPS